HEGPAQRAFVAGSLWLDRPEDRAHANLRTALWRLRACGFPLVQTCGLQRISSELLLRSAVGR
ncbi:MAG: hypothetical protein QOI64_397, partial [Solirubrobacteraceae bacterium]|nr:hypothetical protein [Solirubrobacteraceae bacterium]